MGKVLTGMGIAASLLKEAAKDEKLMKWILGTYSNGNARSIPDMLNGELISPEDRLLITERMKDLDKKKKKKRKKKQEVKKKKKKKNTESSDYKKVIDKYFE